MRATTFVGLLLAFLLAAPTPGQDEIQEIYRLFRQGRAKACMAQCRALPARHPDHPAAHHVLGRLLLREGETQRAIAHLEACLAARTRPAWMTAWSHVALGEAYARRGDRARALRHLNEAITLDATRNATAPARRPPGEPEPNAVPAAPPDRAPPAAPAPRARPLPAPGGPARHRAPPWAVRQGRDRDARTRRMAAPTSARRVCTVAASERPLSGRKGARDHAGR